MADRFVTKEVVARAINTTTRMVDYLVQKGMPKEGRNKFDLGKCMMWYIRFLQEENKRRVGVVEGTQGVMSQRERGQRIKNDREEVKLMAERKEVVRIEEQAQLWDDAVLRMRARLLAAATKFAPYVLGIKSPGEAREKLKRVTQEALREIVLLGDEFEVTTNFLSLKEGGK